MEGGDVTSSVQCSTKLLNLLTYHHTEQLNPVP